MSMIARAHDKAQRGNRVRTIWKGRFGPIVRAVLSISLVAALAYHIGSGEIIGHLKAVLWRAFGAATLLLAISVFL
jgi:hypothetical protein